MAGAYKSNRSSLKKIITRRIPLSIPFDLELSEEEFDISQCSFDIVTSLS